MNSVVLSGRLATEPDLRQTLKGDSVCSFRIAVKRPNSEKTDFINCVSWHDVGETVGKYFTKGQWIEVEGFIQVSELKYSAEKKNYITEVRCESVLYRGKKIENNLVSNKSEQENGVAFSSQFTVEKCDMPV